MSIIEVFQPKFETLHSTPVVLWMQKNKPFVAINLLEQYRQWMNSQLPKHEPADAFWNTCGPAKCRALNNHKADALVFWFESDRKVSYKWFVRKQASPSSVDANWWQICDVRSEGGGLGQDTRVIVQLPTDEDVSYGFNNATMTSWYRKPKILESTPVTPLGTPT